MAFQDPLSVIPNSLSTLIDRIISKRKRGSREALDRKVPSISHAIMSAASPRFFLSMFQVGLSVHMHRRLGSANAVNILHNLSFAAFCKESKRYELSAIMSSTPEIIDSSFHQWIFDNADVNTRTLDGYGTWHGMGGAMAVTPSKSVFPVPIIHRLQTMPSIGKTSPYINLLKIPAKCNIASGFNGLCNSQ